jgi:hypothetical protein
VVPWTCGLLSISDHRISLPRPHEKYYNISHEGRYEGSVRFIDEGEVFGLMGPTSEFVYQRHSTAGYEQGQACCLQFLLIF